MATTDFQGFLTTVLLYGVVCLTVIIFFGLFRRSSVAYSFYNPARFGSFRKGRRPPILPSSLFGWINSMWKYGQADITEVAGYDAATFIRTCAFGVELFLFLSIWCCLVVLPCNISGNQINYLIGKNAVPTSPFTYWVPPPPPPLPPGSQPPPASGPPTKISAPNFYDSKIPPAPPGVTWWKYNADVPPLPQPKDYFKNTSRFDNYYWKYDANYFANDYTFSNLDVTSLSNIGSGDPRLWVHFISTWVISLYLWKLLRRYNQEMVCLRIQYLTRPERSVEARTVLVRDIPGVYYGTLADRVERTALRFLPAVCKRVILRAGGLTARLADQGVNFTVGNFSQVILPDTGVMAHSRSFHHNLSRANSSIHVTTPPQQGQDNSEGAQGTVTFHLSADDDAQLSADNGVSTSQFVEEQFNDVFHDQVEAVNICHDARTLDKASTSYNAAFVGLEDLLDEYISLDKRKRKLKAKRMTIVGLKYGDWAVAKYGSGPCRVDALDFQIELLKQSHEECLRLCKECLPPNEQVMPAAFVTFKNRRCQRDAASGMFHHDRSAWITEPAPGPEEILWKNIGWRKWERKIRFIMIWAFFFLMVAFYIPVVSAIQAFLQIDRLMELPGIRDVAEWPVLSSLFSALLPSLVLRIFLAVLPYLLEYMGHVEGLTSLSSVQHSVVKKYFTFQFLTVFLTSLVAGTIISQLQQVVNDPRSIVTSLGAAAPQTATFFMLYLLLTGFIVKPVQFLRLPGLILLHIQTLFAGTERAKARLWENQYVDFGWEVPDACTTILLGLVYCIIQPMIAPVAMTYFVVNVCLYKYQLIYVHRPQFESGGLVWQQVFDHVMFSAIVFQIVMLGFMSLKGGLVKTLLLLPLPFLFAMLWSSSKDIFSKPLRVLSQRAATDMDKVDHKMAGQEEEQLGKYRHASFNRDEDKLQKLLEEAEIVREALHAQFRRPGSLAKQLEDNQEIDIESGQRKPRNARESDLTEGLLDNQTASDANE